jgi:hypothetical protein
MPFSFKIGKGDVIQGQDEGGKQILNIYFEVELLGIGAIRGRIVA